MGQEPSVKSTTITKLRTLAAKVNTLRRPVEQKPSRECMNVMRRLSIKHFGGDFDRWLEAKMIREREEISAQLLATGATTVDWGDIDDAMMGWALQLMGEVDESRNKVVNLH